MSEARQREIDEALTRRLTEVMAAAGVPHARASLEVLYMLPGEFLRTYAELFHSALKFADGTGAGSAGDELEKGGAGRSEDRGVLPMLSSGGGKRYKEHWIVKSDDALELKGKADKRLRALGRDIQSTMMFGELGEGNVAGVRIKCDRCGRIMGGDWNFCSYCGNHRPHGE